MRLLLLLSFVVFVTIPSTFADISPVDRSLQPPTDVKVEAVSDTSMTLSWQSPNTSSSTPTLLSYVIQYRSENEIERTMNVSAHDNSKMVTDLQPSTDYTVAVSAIYSGNRNVSLPKFVVSTGPRNEPEAVCDCHSPGTSSCDTVSGSRSKRCSCKNGYKGNRCDACAKDFYLSGDECQPCACSTFTSSGECDINVELQERRTCHCKSGHMGPNCTECDSHNFWYEDRCLPCKCLQSCPSNDPESMADCRNCTLMLNATAAGLHSCDVTQNDGLDPKSERRLVHGDGTVALIAVLVSLGFIAIVAGSVTCYRYKCQRPSHHTFWSMELHEEKISLNSACDYQRLDAAVAATGSSSAAPSGGGGDRHAATGSECGPSSTLRSSREETRNGYHSMSM